jgi:hypothetical protein
MALHKWKNVGHNYQTPKSGTAGAAGGAYKDINAKLVADTKACYAEYEADRANNLASAFREGNTTPTEHSNLKKIQDTFGKGAGLD